MWRDSAVRCYTATRNRKAYLLFKPALRETLHTVHCYTATRTRSAYLLFKPPSSYHLSAPSQFCRHQVVGHLQCHKRHVPSFTNYIRIRIRLSKYYSLTSVYDRYHILFLDAIASPSTYPCQWVGQWVSEWFIVSDLEIAIASPSFASLFYHVLNDGI